MRYYKTHLVWWQCYYTASGHCIASWPRLAYVLTDAVLLFIRCQASSALKTARSVQLPSYSMFGVLLPTCSST